jgi:hypothetical protein
MGITRMRTDIQPPPLCFMLKACVEGDWHFILAHCDGEPFFIPVSADPFICISIKS